MSAFHKQLWFKLGSILAGIAILMNLAAGFCTGVAFEMSILFCYLLYAPNIVLNVFRPLWPLPPLMGYFLSGLLWFVIGALIGYVIQKHKKKRR